MCPRVLSVGAWGSGTAQDLHRWVLKQLRGEVFHVFKSFFSDTSFSANYWYALRRSLESEIAQIHASIYLHILNNRCADFSWQDQSLPWTLLVRNGSAAEVLQPNRCATKEQSLRFPSQGSSLATFGCHTMKDSFFSRWPSIPWGAEVKNIALILRFIDGAQRSRGSCGVPHCGKWHVTNKSLETAPTQTRSKEHFLLERMRSHSKKIKGKKPLSNSWWLSSFTTSSSKTYRKLRCWQHRGLATNFGGENVIPSDSGLRITFAAFGKYSFAERCGGLRVSEISRKILVTSTCYHSYFG